MLSHIEKFISKIIFLFEKLSFPNLNLHYAAVEFAFLIIGVLILASLVNFFLSNSVLGKSYRIFVAPGVIIHELSHAFACLVTGAKISKVSLFDKEGGKVEHGSSKIPIIGQVLISTAPLIFGIVIVYLLSQKIGLEKVNFESMKLSYSEIFSSIKNFTSNIDFGNRENLILIYLVFSLTVTMSPSRQDFKNIMFSIVVIFFLALIVYQFKHFDMSKITIPVEVVTMLSTTLFLLILVLLLSIILYMVTKLISR